MDYFESNDARRLSTLLLPSPSWCDDDEPKRVGGARRVAARMCGLWGGRAWGAERGGVRRIVRPPAAEVSRPYPPLPPCHRWAAPHATSATAGAPTQPRRPPNAWPQRSLGRQRVGRRPCSPPPRARRRPAAAAALRPHTPGAPPLRFVFAAVAPARLPVATVGFVSPAHPRAGGGCWTAAVDGRVAGSAHVRWPLLPCGGRCCRAPPSRAAGMADRRGALRLTSLLSGPYTPPPSRRKRQRCGGVGGGGGGSNSGGSLWDGAGPPVPVRAADGTPLVDAPGGVVFPSARGAPAPAVGRAVGSVAGAAAKPPVAPPPIRAGAPPADENGHSTPARDGGRVRHALAPLSSNALVERQLWPPSAVADPPPVGRKGDGWLEVAPCRPRPVAPAPSAGTVVRPQDVDAAADDRAGATADGESPSTPGSARVARRRRPAVVRGLSLGSSSFSSPTGPACGKGNPPPAEQNARSFFPLGSRLEVKVHSLKSPDARRLAREKLDADTFLDELESAVPVSPDHDVRVGRTSSSTGWPVCPLGIVESPARSGGSARRAACVQGEDPVEGLPDDPSDGIPRESSGQGDDPIDGILMDDLAAGVRGSCSEGASLLMAASQDSVDASTLIAGMSAANAYLKFSSSQSQP